MSIVMEDIALDRTLSTQEVSYNLMQQMQLDQPYSSSSHDDTAVAPDFYGVGEDYITI